MNKPVDERLRRYELLIAHSRDIILFVRRGDGRILEANAAATKAYGYSREELLSLTINDLRAVEMKSLTVDQLAKADAQGILFETVHRRKDGNTFPVEVSSQGANIDGTRTLISIVRDITERRSAEARILSLARYPEENPNPILRASDKGALLYANPPALAMMEPMGWREELPLPESLLVPVREAMNGGQYREIELTCQLGKVWSLTLLPDVSEKHVTVYAREITAQEKAERELRESEERVREKLDSILSPEGDIGKLELADIIDSHALQALMVHYYELAHFPIGIIDLKGKVLVGVGWQEICTRFHRVHPDACMHCIESDTQLSAGVPPGEFRLYKCKNNMWDIATPIMVGGQHVGNVFSGQFFFEDEPLDHELFQSQAREYGFNEQEYIAALETVPRVSRKSVNTCMAFFAKLADMISQLSYSNIKLARTMAERETLTDSLRQNESLLRTVMDNSPDPIFLKNHDGQMLLANPATLAVMGGGADEVIGKTIQEYITAPEIRRSIVENDQRVMASGQTEVVEETVPGSTGPRTFLTTKAPYYDSEGRVIGLVGVARDITDRKQAEQTLQRSRDELEEKVRERTAELKSLTEDLEKSRDDLRKLASELVLTEERERKRLAVTLHDEVAQTLAAARMRVDLMRSISGSDAFRQSFEQAQELLSYAIQQTRALMKDISNPVLYDMGLRSAVEAMAEQIKDRHGIQVKCSFEGQLRSLGQDLNVMVFQVVKELLQNVIKHSGARGASIRITEDENTVRTVVADDGEGFDVNENNSPDFIEGGFGLFSIRERVKSFNGSIQIKSKPGIGSKVTVVLPKTAGSKAASPKSKKRKKG